MGRRAITAVSAALVCIVMMATAIGSTFPCRAVADGCDTIMASTSIFANALRTENVGRTLLAGGTSTGTHV